MSIETDQPYKMKILELPYKLLTFAGIWRPEHYTSWRQKTLWSLYSSFTIGIVIVQLVTQLGRIITANNMEEISDSLFLTPTMCTNLQKIYVAVVHRDRIFKLIKMFLKDFCVPRNSDEATIQAKYEHTIRIITLGLLVLIHMTVANMVILPFLHSKEIRTLPMNVWLPYNLDTNTAFWFTYTEQSLGIYVIGLGVIGGTAMINGYVYHVCGQYELLSYRLSKLPKTVERLQLLNKPYYLICQYQKMVIKETVDHHLYIFELTKVINSTFEIVIFQQFIMTAVLVSMGIYKLSLGSQKDVANIMILFYLMCILSVLFIYSWFSNELMYQSVNFKDRIYSMDWTSLSTSTGKDLILIMLCATSKPMFIYCGHFIVLSLASYIGILKVSYSVFNLLRSTNT